MLNRAILFGAILAAVAVVLAYAIADNRGSAHGVLPAAIAIAAVVVVAEVLLDRERRRRADAESLLKALTEQQRRAAAARPAFTAEVATVTQPVPEAPPEPRPLPTPIATRPFQSSDRRALDPQCPSCGRFSVDVAPGRNAADFRCRSCGAAWGVRRGAPWPEVRVVADLRKLDRTT